MAELIKILLGIWQSIVAVICIVIAIIAGRKYTERKNKVALLLFIAFIFAALAALFQASPTMIMDVFEITLVSPVEWFNTYILQEFLLHQYAYFFLCFSIYFLFLFSMELLLKEEQKINLVVKIIPLVFLALIIIYGTFFDFKIEPTSDLGEILKSIDTWVGLYIVVLVFPSLIISIRIIRTLPKAEPTRKRMIHILLFSISIIVLIINFVIETFIVAQPNAFSFIAWVFAVTALFEAYLGLYKK